MISIDYDNAGLSLMILTWAIDDDDVDNDDDDDDNNDNDRLFNLLQYALNNKAGH